MTSRNQDFLMNLDKLVQICFYPMRQIRVIHRSLTLEVVKTVLCSLKHSQIGYCNSLC